MAAVGIDAVAAKRSDLHVPGLTRYGDHTKLSTHRKAIGEQTDHLIRSGVGCDVVVLGSKAHHDITHTSTHEIRLESMISQTLEYLGRVAAPLIHEFITTDRRTYYNQSAGHSSK